MDNVDLSLVSTEKLIEELLDNRCDYGVIALKRLENQKGVQSDIRRWIGNTHTIAGMCLDLANGAIKDYNDKQTITFLGEDNGKE